VPGEIRLIDCLHLGRPRVIGCWVVDDVLIDPGPSSCLQTLLGELGGLVPRALLLTHIHLDHAGASGSLLRRWPHLEVYVHERGARHLASPERLLASARQLWGDAMERLWGEVVSVPQERLRVLRGGERLALGGGRFEVAYTPGHASHHVSYLHESGIAFVGDVAGVRVVPGGPVIPPTPPPDIDLEAWHASIELVAGWSAQRLAITHFGDLAAPAAQLRELGERLDRWAELARVSPPERFEAVIAAEIERAAGPEAAAAYAQAAPREQIYAGLRRYWEKRAAA
jgi:glyoxylase-like metal-dependent hydrolase (beta-lactamase superfamily II)